jgi:hypothetical protein
MVVDNSVEIFTHRINCLIHVINRGVHGCPSDRHPGYPHVTPDAILRRVGFLLEIERPC